MSISNMLAQVATIYPKSGYNKYGRDVSGTGTNVKCRFQNKTRTVMMSDQQVIQLVGIFYFTGDIVINTEDRITYAGASYKVFGLNGSIDGHGTQRIIKVEVTKWQM